MAKNEDNNTALLLACRGGKIKELKDLVEAGADVNFRDEHDNTPLSEAANWKKAEKVKYLLEHDAKPTDKAVFEAIGGWESKDPAVNVEILRLLFDAGANVACKALVAFAVKNKRHPDIVRYLTEREADIDSADDDGNTALHWAWILDAHDIFQYLLSKNASRTIRNNSGWAIGDIYNADCTGPKVLNISLYETAQEQNIRFRLKAIYKAVFDNDSDMTKAIKFIEGLCTWGLAGSDRFAPEESSVTWNTKPPKSDSIQIGEFELSLTVKAISRAAFSAWIMMFFQKHFTAMELEIIAEPVAGEKPTITRFGIPSPTLEKDAKELFAMHEKSMGDGPEICRWAKVILENKYATDTSNASGDTSVKLDVDKLIKAKKEKAAADLLIGHFTSEKVEDIAQFPELVDGLVMTLGNSDPVQAVRLFTAYKDAGGIADCPMYSNYTYAASFIEDEQMMRRTIADFNSDMEKYGKEFVRDSSDYSTTLCNIAALFAKLHEKKNMLDCLKKVKKYHHDYESLKDEEDFANYQDDPDFLKLFE